MLERISDRSSPESVRRETISELAEMGPELADSLARLARDRKLRIPEAVYRDVLPELGDDFRALHGLTSRDVLVRRRAAVDLARLAARAPLRLAEHRPALVALYDGDGSVGLERHIQSRGR